MQFSRILRLSSRESDIIPPMLLNSMGGGSLWTSPQYWRVSQILIGLKAYNEALKCLVRVTPEYCGLDVSCEKIDGSIRQFNEEFSKRSTNI